MKSSQATGSPALTDSRIARASWFMGRCPFNYTLGEREDMQTPPLIEASATLHARCERCDCHRMFNVGTINSADTFSSVWQYIESLSHVVCDECGASKWATSLRLGVVRPVTSQDVVVAMAVAVEMTPAYLN